MEISAKNYRVSGGSAAPVILLFVSAAICFLLKGGIEAEYLAYLLSRAAVLCIITLGAIIVFSLGAFGISLGVSTLVSVATGAFVYAETDSLALSFVVCLLVPVIGCLASSLLSVVFSLPAYVTAALMLGIFGSVARLVPGIEGGIFTGLGEGSPYSSLLSRLTFLALFFIFCYVLYCILPIGKKQRAIGEDPAVARLMGISRRLYSSIGFAVAGLGVGLGGFLILCSYPSISRASVSDLGFNIIFAIILGGMSLRGGASSRLSAAVVGSMSAILLGEVIFLLMGEAKVFAPLSQIIRGTVLLIFMALSARKRDLFGRRLS